MKSPWRERRDGVAVGFGLCIACASAGEAFFQKACALIVLLGLWVVAENLVELWEEWKPRSGGPPP